MANGDSREFREAVKAFQGDLGSNPTGVLTVAQSITLEDRAAWLRTAWVDPWLRTQATRLEGSSSMTTVLEQDEESGNVRIEGLLASRALPPNRVLAMFRAECQKQSMRCTAGAVALDGGEWTDHRIVASAQLGSDATLCLVLLPQSGKAYAGDEEVLPLVMPAEVQRRTEQIYSHATRTIRHRMENEGSGIPGRAQGSIPAR